MVTTHTLKLRKDNSPVSRGSFRSVSALLLVAAASAGCTVMPSPMDRSEVRAQLAADMVQLPGREQKIEGVVDFERALVHAIFHNRSLRLKTLESALSRREVGTTALGMLPQLTAEAGYNKRNKYDASTSVVLIDGEPDTLPSEPAYSISEGLERQTRDVTFSWNLLDFGLSYVRANQFADRHLIEAERERKVLHTISGEVRAAYWKAVSAERLLPKIDPLIEKANKFLAEARSLEEDRVVPPQQALDDQRTMLDILRLLQDLKKELAVAKVELAEIMGLHPAAEFELADVRSPDFGVPELHTAIETLEQAALENRPEMREAQYQTRVSAREVRIALMKLMPNIRLTAQDSYENNEYLRSQNWQTFGASVNFNLFNVFAVVPTQRLGEARKELADEQRLATAMTILAQVHMSAAQFAEAKDAYGFATEYVDIAERIVDQADAQVATQNAGNRELIREQLNAVLAEVRRDRAYADLQDSFGRVMDSAGIDLFPRDYRVLDTESLTAVLQKRFDQISSGDLPLTPPPTEQEKANKRADAAKQSAENALSAANQAAGDADTVGAAAEAALEAARAAQESANEATELMEQVPEDREVSEDVPVDPAPAPLEEESTNATSAQESAESALSAANNAAGEADTAESAADEALEAARAALKSAN